MFQPASVRTLLHMRSSPKRPATVGNRRCCFQDQEGAGGLERRPLTAPAVAQGHPSSSSDQGHEYDDEEGDSDEDSSLVLADASAAIHHLKNTWRDERREKLSLLWRQLETSYKRMPPTSILDEILDPIQGNEQENADLGFSGDANALDGHAEISDAEAAAGPAMCAADKEAETAADAIITSAADQLSSCQQRRKALEECRKSFPSSPTACIAWPEQADMAGGNAIPGVGFDEAERLRVLRSEVERLRTPQSGVQLAQSINEGAPCMPMQTCPDSVHEALNLWIQDMTILHEDSRGAPKITSPRRASQGKGTTPSKKAMAQIAEARAMEWATGQKNDMSRDVLRANVHVAPNRTERTCPSPRRSGGLAPVPVANALASQAPGTVEQHLDDILREFDEIDSIYGSVVKITQQ